MADLNWSSTLAKELRVLFLTSSINSLMIAVATNTLNTFIVSASYNRYTGHTRCPCRKQEELKHWIVCNCRSQQCRLCCKELKAAAAILTTPKYKAESIKVAHLQRYHRRAKTSDIPCFFAGRPSIEVLITSRYASAFGLSKTPMMLTCMQCRPHAVVAKNIGMIYHRDKTWRDTSSCRTVNLNLY